MAGDFQEQILKHMEYDVQTNPTHKMQSIFDWLVEYNMFRGSNQTQTSIEQLLNLQVPV